MNILTWAESSELAQLKINKYLATFKWHIVAIEEAKIVTEDFLADNDEFQEAIDRARDNPLATIVGTFHSCKAD